LTVSPETSPLVCETLEAAVEELRTRGMRLSTVRRLVLEALFAAEGPVSAVHLSGTLSLDATSVYRNLEVLERHGLIRHVHLGHGPGLYVLSGRDEVEYLYCDRCTLLTPVNPAQLDPLRGYLQEGFGHEVRFTHFALVGVCAGCARGQSLARLAGAYGPGAPKLERSERA
jgi:Fur family ferric uptake transcriptional regulator